MTSTGSADQKYRVKVYELTEEGEWGDQGTGHVQFQVVQSVEAAYIFVHSEVDSSLILESKVIMEPDAYQRQGETIISWNDPSSKQDIALSFADLAGCQDIWEKLCAVRGVDPTASSREDDDQVAQSNFTIPAVTLENLPQIRELLTDISPVMREPLANALIQENYVKHLVDLFNQLEKENDTKNLVQLYSILKLIILLNEGSMFDHLLSDSEYLGVFGILEYDPDQASNKPNHRAFLQQNAKFKQVVPFEDPMIIARIHQNFRVQYLKDSVLTRMTDDQALGTLNSIIFFNNIEILQQLQKSPRFLPELFQKFAGLKNLKPEERLQQQKDLLRLLQEMCQMTKSFQLTARNNFFKNLTAHGVLNIFEDAMQNPDLKARLLAFDILTACVATDPSNARKFMLEQNPETGLMGQLVRRIGEDEDHGMREQAVEFIKLLLDPDSLETAAEKTQFLAMFYDNFLARIVSYLSIEQLEGVDRKQANVTRNYVCDLLTFLVQHHGYRLKYFVIRNELFDKICELLNEEEKYVVLSGLRFIRACIALKDEFYFTHIVNNNVLQPIVQLFLKNKDVDNLVNSSLLEFFDFIKRENIKPLIAHIVETYEQELHSVTYVNTFNDIWAVHEKNLKGIEIETPSNPLSQLEKGGAAASSSASYSPNPKAAQNRSQIE
eukprot:c21946_g1_i1.p1 GENE.c21946_g1_i1~~c21946_g1_i1.p1  ORF type:complete len:666 (+),score=163.81 c21946_g1_i1:230-2227(+)